MLLRKKWKHSHTSNSKGCGGAEVMASTHKQTNKQMINTEHPMAKSLHTTQHRNMLKPPSKSPIMNTVY
jgi:hypothetical protein